MTDEAIGVLEIGGSHVTSAVVRGTRVGSARRRPLDPAAPATELIASFAGAIAQTPAPIGIPWVAAVPGPFDYATGIGRYAGVGKFDSLNGVHLDRQLRDALAPRPLDIRFLNDADAFAIGEWHNGAGAQVDRCVGITLGSGIGSTFLDHGVPVSTGPTVPPDGEMHLTQLAGNDLEDLISRRAILARYRARGGVDPQVDVKDIFERARAGEAWATEVLRAAFTLLGRALAPWLRSFAAEVVVVGGAMAAGWDIIHPALAEGVALDIPLRRSPDPVRSALVGAAVYLRNQLPAV
jgi:glucokinase